MNKCKINKNVKVNYKKNYNKILWVYKFLLMKVIIKKLLRFIIIVQIKIK